ncbi:MAG: hypothetical protein HC905_31320 [Bacteroidales bacterium]|nr:hypothetical protein [Bacteroidales bacterium]
MKSLLVTILIFISCSTVQEESRYLKEYTKYEGQVRYLISGIQPVLKDSMVKILDDYTHRASFLSCTWCVAEGAIFKPVSDFCNRHPEAMALVLDRSLIKTQELVWGFRALYKEHYPIQYSKLLEDYGIVLRPEDEMSTENERWANKIEEFRLPLKIL